MPEAMFVDRHLALPAELDDLLATCNPAETVIYADMTGTLLAQLPGGFPEESQHSLRSFLRREGKLVVISGDALGTGREFLVNPLGSIEGGALYLIMGAGYSIDVLRPGHDLAPLHRSRPAPEAVRRELLVRIETIAASQVGKFDFRFAAEEIEAFFGPDGARFNIAPQLNIDGTLYVEVLPNKLTMFFPGQPKVTTGPVADILDALSQDARVLELARLHRLHVHRGGNFVDIISTLKEEGIATLSELEPGIVPAVARPNIVLLGDSANDRGIFLSRYPSHARVLKIFVGTDEGLEQCGLRRGEAGTYFLEKYYVRGSQLVLTRLASYGAP